MEVTASDASSSPHAVGLFRRLTHTFDEAFGSTIPALSQQWSRLISATEDELSNNDAAAPSSILHEMLSKPTKQQKVGDFLAVIKSSPNEATLKHPATGSLALHRATQPQVVQALLDVNAAGARERDNSGCVPLHHASTLAVLKLLLAACPEAAGMPDHSGYLPLHVALYKARPKELVVSATLSIRRPLDWASLAVYTCVLSRC